MHRAYSTAQQGSSEQLRPKRKLKREQSALSNLVEHKARGFSSPKGLGLSPVPILRDLGRAWSLPEPDSSPVHRG